MTEPVATVTGIQPGLQIRGLDRGQTPVADLVRRCGHHQRATGRTQVQRLLAHTRTCPDCNTPAPAAPTKEAA